MQNRTRSTGRTGLTGPQQGHWCTAEARIPCMHRRHFLGTLAAAPVAAALTATHSSAQARPVKPKRLAAGDTVTLVAPATATFQTVDLQIARESLEALGLKVKVGAHLLDRHGYLAGDDKDRADDINRAFADTTNRAVIAIRGGWGSSRVLPYLDFDMIRRNPKILLGYSDITALHLSVQAKGGFVTFHGPIGMGRWDTWSVDYWKRVLMQGEPVTFENPKSMAERNSLTQIENRVQTIVPGTARGRLLGGNLTVLTTILGSPYVPDWQNCIFFCEDVDENLYRIDRMFTQLKLAGILPKIRGFVFGTCSECKPGDGYASLTLEEILNDHIKPLGVPAWQGAMIGHAMPQWTLPEGLDVEIDATKGTIRMLEPAVA
jgi:muramoyltetrapeptide carboxypeptidase